MKHDSPKTTHPAVVRAGVATPAIYDPLPAPTIRRNPDVLVLTEIRDRKSASSSLLDTGRLSARSRQKGITLVEVLAVLAIAALFISFALPKINEAFFNTKREQAYSEINDVIIVAQQYRQVNGGYDGLDDIATLVDNGYGLQKWTDGEGENAYGKDVIIVEKSGNAEVKYGFDDEQGCTQIAARLAQNTALSELDADDPGASCDTSFVLTFEVN